MVAHGKCHIAVLKPQIVPIGIAESMLAGVGMYRDIDIPSLSGYLYFSDLSIETNPSASASPVPLIKRPVLAS